MARHSQGALLSNVVLDRGDSLSLVEQLSHQLRSHVLSGAMLPGTRLPSTRTLSQELGVARLIAVDAFEQLIAEGYFEGRAGSGTFVNSKLPENSTGFFAPRDLSLDHQLDPVPKLASRGRTLVEEPSRSLASPPWPLSPNVPGFDLFPFQVWAKLHSRHCRSPSDDNLAYGNPAGLMSLRNVIAAYVADARGITCSSDQVVIVAGAQQAFAISSLLLTDPGDKVWVEDPGPSKPCEIFSRNGAKLIQVPVDHEGIIVKAGIAQAENARLALVTPSHQLPLGMTMSLPRRLELLRWAKKNQSWIIEDDYDSEYRYVGRPLPALQGLDRDGRVIYVGTFSKVLFPSLRIGYLIVPENLIESYHSALVFMARALPTIEQAILADFIEEGYLATHIRRMRLAYIERQDTLISLLHKELGGVLNVHKTDTGFNVIADLPDSIRDIDIYHAAYKEGIIAYPLSVSYVNAPARNSLILGFASTPQKELPGHVKKLARILKS